MKFIKFYKPNCDPCKFLSKVLSEINDVSFEVEEIDITKEENKKYVESYEIERVPVLLSLRSGNILRGLKKPVYIKEFVRTEVSLQ